MLIPQTKPIFIAEGFMSLEDQETHSCSICGKENCVLFEFNGSQYCLEHYQQITNEQSLKPQLSSSEKSYQQKASELPGLSLSQDSSDESKAGLEKEKVVFLASSKGHHELPLSGLVPPPVPPVPEKTFPENTFPPTTTSSVSDTKKGPSVGCVVFLAIAALIGWILYLVNISKINDYQKQVSSLENQVSNYSQKLDQYECSGVSQYSLDFSSEEMIQSSLNELVTQETGEVASQDYSNIFSNARVALYKVHTDQYLEEFVVFYEGDLSYSNAVFWINRSC